MTFIVKNEVIQKEFNREYLRFIFMCKACNITPKKYAMMIKMGVGSYPKMIDDHVHELHKAFSDLKKAFKEKYRHRLDIEVYSPFIPEKQAKEANKKIGIELLEIIDPNFASVDNMLYNGPYFTTEIDIEAELENLAQEG